MDPHLEKIYKLVHEKAKKHKGVNKHPHLENYSKTVAKFALHKWVKEGRTGDISIIIDQELDKWAKIWEHQNIHQGSKK